MKKLGVINFLLYFFTIVQSLLISVIIVKSVSSVEIYYFIMLFGTFETIYVSMYIAKSFERERVWNPNSVELVYLHSTMDSVHTVMLVAFSFLWGMHTYGYYIQSKVMFLSTMFLIIYFVVMVNVSALVSVDVFRTISRNKKGRTGL